MRFWDWKGEEITTLLQMDVPRKGDLFYLQHTSATGKGTIIQGVVGDVMFDIVSDEQETKVYIDVQILQDKVREEANRRRQKAAVKIEPL